MRAIRFFTAVSLTLLAVAAHAEPAANPLIGEWQMEGRPDPVVLGHRHLLFAPEAMILDRATAVAVRGYDVADGAVRVRTGGGGDLLFIVDDADRICLAETAGLQALPSMPTVKASERCFARRDPTRS